MSFNRVLAVLTLAFFGLSNVAMAASLKEVAMPGDGDCLFWSLTAHRFNASDWHGAAHRKATRALRQKVAGALSDKKYEDTLSLFLISDENPYQTPEAYIQAFQSGRLDGGELEIKVASDLLGVNVAVHLQNGTTIEYPAEQGSTITTHLQYHPGHYNYLTEST